MKLVRRFTSTQVRQRRRKILYIRAGIICGLLLSSLLFISQLFSLSPISIQRVVFEGNDTLSSDALLSSVRDVLSGRYGFLISRRSIFFFPENEITRVLQEQFKRIESLSIDRTGFQELTITITERKPFALWCASVVEVVQHDVVEGMSQEEQVEKRNCYFLDSKGFVFDRSPRFSFGMFTMFSGGELGEDPIGVQFLNPHAFIELSAFINGLSRLDLRPRSVADEGGHFRAVFSVMSESDTGEVEILFTKSDSYEKIISDITLIASSPDIASDTRNPFAHITSIDMRFGNRVFYKTDNPAQ